MARKTNEKQKSRDSRELLELAVNCRFITSEQEREILPELQAYAKKRRGNFTARFLIEKKLLSREKVKLLFSVKKHLATLMADRKFGKIGVANSFVSHEDVRKALELQVAIFRKKKKSVKIGDILVNNRQMSLEDQTAVLLTQDRIKDEYLEQALNTVAASEIDRIAMNRRFGAIAVKKELITMAQLNQALRAQKKASGQDGENLRLGDILKKQFALSQNDINGILKAQKKLEVKRMNLEAKVEEYNQEKAAGRNLDLLFEYHVSGDRLCAHVVQVKKNSAGPVNRENFLKWLSLSGISFGITSTDKIDLFLNANREGEQITIARGETPKNTSAAPVQFFFNTDGQVGQAESVLEGDVLAELSVATFDGPEGRDVFGRAVPLPEGAAGSLRCGEGVVRRENEFVALIDGYPRLYEEQVLFVLPRDPEYTTRQIQGDITEDILAPLAILKVEGNIASGIKVSCHRLEIKGDILGHVSATADVDVTGTIGREPGEETEIYGMTTIESGGMVHAGREIIHSTITGDKGINAPKSGLISSQVSSYGDIVLGYIESSRKAPCILQAGRGYHLKMKQLESRINQKQAQLNELLDRDELNLLSSELMEQVQVQNGYLEKQNVALYLHRILNESKWEELETVDAKIEACEKERQQERQGGGDSTEAAEISIPGNTKAHGFMQVICRKIEALTSDEQKLYTKELLDSISGMYKSAVRATERINKELDAMAAAAREHAGQPRLEIEEKKNEIAVLESAKADLSLTHRESSSGPLPSIKVKAKVSRFTIIKGESTRMIMEKDIYGVTLREEKGDAGNPSKISIDGYFG